MSRVNTAYQYFTPDWNRIQKIILSFKGNRTMAQYADACGSISASTMSRIITGKATRPLTMDMMILLYNNRDKNTEYSFEDLINANGMIDEETHKRLTAQSPNMSVSESRSRETMMRGVILRELVERGVIIKVQHASMTYRERIEKESAGDIVLRPDLTLTLLESKENNTWNLDFITSIADGGSALRRARSIARWQFEKKAIYLIADAWAADKYKDTKTSFVFLDENIYNAFRSYFRNNGLHNTMSVILIDPESEKVVKEEILNLGQGNEQTSLFELPLIDDDSDYYDESEDEDLEYLESLMNTFTPKDD